MLFFFTIKSTTNTLNITAKTAIILVKKSFPKEKFNALTSTIENPNSIMKAEITKLIGLDFLKIVVIIVIC